MYLKKNYLLLPAVFTGVYIENRSFYTEKDRDDHRRPSLLGVSVIA